VDSLGEVDDMVAITPNSMNGSRGPKLQPAKRAASAGVIILILPAMALAQERTGDEGIFITVQKPITSAVVDHIKAKTDRALQRKVRTIVYDFNPVRHATGTDEYGPCRDLADYILSRLQSNTVAFVHKDVTGHRLLPVLACKEIAMSAEARLGNDLTTRPEGLGEDQKHFYRHIAEHWGRSRAALIMKMLDPSLEVLEGTYQGAIAYVTRTETPPPGFVKLHQEPILPAGVAGFYSAADAQKFGLCKLIRNSREEIKDAYDLKPSSLREDPLEGREPKAVRFIVNETISRSMSEAFTRRVRQAVGEHANVIIVQLECGGGDPQVSPPIALDLAEFLRELRDEDEQGRFPVMTIAYVPKSAPGAAAIVALGCTEIVMEKGAEIGDFESIYRPHQGVDVNPERYRIIRETMTDLAVKQGYSPLLVRGMLDRSIWIYQVRSVKGQSERRLVSKEELEADQAGLKQWGEPTLIKKGDPNGQFLTLTAEQARDLDLVREIVDDFQHLKRVYHLENVRDARLDFLYQLAAFLQKPAVSLFLIMIGVTCLILELKMPGVSLPGVIAAICFVLYFWAQSQQLSGQIIMLAILLFILGLLLIALEVFVFPGFSVPGISGVVLVIISLALAMLDKKPETTEEWMNFGQTMGAVGLSLLGAVAMAFVVAWYLPSLPVANRLVLKPPAEASENPDGEEAPVAGHPGVTPEMAALLGAIGVAATTLRPSGIAQIGDAFLDVVSEGSYVQAGSRIQVIEIEGNRIVVKEV
jgi:membrane-bound ClpP family serine protease